MSQSRRIALFMGQDVGFCRDVIRGIRAYAIDKPEWVFQNGPPESSVVQAFRQWKPHGIIAQLLTAELAGEVLKLRKPVVDTSCSVPRLRAPVVDVDHEAVGRLAAEHFLERGHRHFGFFGSDSAHYSKLREASFRRRLAQAGHTVSACYVEYLLRLPALMESKRAAARVRRWLEGLPKPVAILAANDIPARELADACRRFALRVPDDVALLGVDNDDLECGLTSPPLSSVATPCAADRLRGGQVAGRVDGRQAGAAAGRVSAAHRRCDPRVHRRLGDPRRGGGGGLELHPQPRRRRHPRRRGGGGGRRRAAHAGIQVPPPGGAYHPGGDPPRPPAAGQAAPQRHRFADARHRPAAGFSTPQRMSVVFRQATGLTPSAYRQQTQVRDD